MTRIEFSEMLVAAKENSGIGTAELSFAMKLLLPNLKRIETAAHNYSVDKALQYLSNINCTLILAQHKRVIQIKHYQDIAAWLTVTRKPIISQSGLAAAISCSRNAIAKIELQQMKMGVDTFLSIADFFGCDIQIKPNTNGK